LEMLLMNNLLLRLRLFSNVPLFPRRLRT
jgi:hypothetical protein